MHLSMREVKIYGLKTDEQSNELHVKDNGIGISEADLPKIFDKGLFRL